jgi:UDP-glucose 4-epimerase
MKTILITGASGFLADKIFDSLFSLRKYKLVLGARTPSKLSHVEKFKNSDLRIFDVSDETTYEGALIGIDVVIHLAAMDYADCVKNPELAQKVNVTSLENFLSYCNKFSVKQFVYFSTIHVYGANLIGTITEESPTNPANTYSKTHLAAEKIVLGDKSLEGIVVRLSNAVGAPTHADSSAWKLVVNDLCKQAVLNKAIVLNSSGKQLRDFIPASEIGLAIDLLLDKNKTINSNAIYNVGSGEGFRILDVVAIIQKQFEKLLNFRPTIEFKNSPNEKILPFHFSIEKIMKIGYIPDKTLEEEIQNIIYAIIDRK